MRLVAVRRIVTGSKLARPVYTGRNFKAALLNSGVAIDERMKQRLAEAGIPAVWIEDEVSAGIDVEDPISEEARREAMVTIQSAFKDAPLIAAAGRPLPDDVVNELKSVASRIAAEVVNQKDIALALKDLAEADAYTVRHSLDVCVTGLLIGKRLFRQKGWLDHKGNARFDNVEEKLSRLGLGLLLHDIGKLTVPTEILHKENLTEDERELLRRHPIAGAELLKGDHISPLARAVVRSHHERWDGSGYPYGFAGEEIHEFARIAAVANVFDAITSERPGRPAAPTDVGVETIVLRAGTYFDPDVVNCFRKVIAPYPKGTEVQLSDQRRAIVREVSEDNLARPIVRVIEDEHGEPLSTPIDIDLREHPEIVLIGLE